MLLKDGPLLRRWFDGHLGVPPAVAQTITGNVVLSIRRYFLGTTIVASFNAIVVGVGAWILGVPLAGTIAVVTLVTAYVPFVGAFVSGAFAVTLALGSEGTTTALIMLVIVILANGALQNIVQPIAMGATLRHEPAADPRRDDQRRRLLRHGRDDPRGAAHVGGDPHLARPRADAGAQPRRQSRRPSPRLRNLSSPRASDPALIRRARRSGSSILQRR